MHTNTKRLIGFTMLGALTVAAMQSCRSIPKGVVAVKPFDANKYLGKWYEIARLNYRFERNLKNVTAQYSFNDNGTIKVVNKGYDYKENKWKESTGKAKFRNGSDEGKLKVSFFGPFYAGYNVIAIDPSYSYALVAGSSLKYLWLLSRQKTMPLNVKAGFLEKAKAAGYDTDALVWVEHNENTAGFQ